MTQTKEERKQRKKSMNVHLNTKQRKKIIEKLTD